MSARDDPDASPGRARDRRWRPEPEVGPASGGHLTPEVGPVFETSDLSARSAGEPTRSMPPVEAQRQRSSPAEAARRRRPTMRRVRRTLRHVDPVSVFKLSLFFYGIGLIVWLVFVAIVYSMINATGIFDSIEDVSRGLALGWRLEIDLWFVEKWALLVGVIMWIFLSLTNLLISFLYNVGADTIGGVEMTFVERDS